MKWIITLYPGLILFSGGLFLSLLIIFGADFNGLYGQDAYAYYRYSRSIDLFSLSPVNLPGGYWPVTFPLTGSILQLFFHSDTLAMQLVSALSYAGSAAVCYHMLRVRYKAKNTILLIYVMTFFLLSPYVLRFSVLIMSDMLCTFFILLTYYYTVNEKNTEAGSLFAAVIFAVLAVTTRYVAVLLLFWPLLHVMRRAMLQNKLRVVLAAVGSGFLLFALLEHLKVLSPLNLLQHRAITTWSVRNLFSTALLDGTPDAGSEHFPNIIAYAFWIVHPAYIFAGSLFLAITAMTFRSGTTKADRWIWITLIAYVLFISGTPFQNKRLLLPVFPIFLVLIFPGFDVIVNRLSKRLSYLLLACCLCLQCGLAYAAVRIPVSRAVAEKATVTAIDLFNRDRLPVYNSGLDGPILYYSPKTVFHPLYNTRIRDFHDPFILVADSQRMMSGNLPLLIRDNISFIYGNFTLVRRSQLSDNLIIYEFRR